MCVEEDYVLMFCVSLDTKLSCLFSPLTEPSRPSAYTKQQHPQQQNILIDALAAEPPGVTQTEGRFQWSE